MKSSTVFVALVIAFLVAARPVIAQTAPADMPSTAAQERNEVGSRVAEVTVFSDRALVTRRADTVLPAGETTLVFTDLPAGTDPSSLQVGGTGAFTLRDVRIETRQRTRDVSAAVKALEDERRGYEERLQAESDRVREADAERVFLAEIAKRLTSNAGSSEVLPLDVAAWAKMLDFHRARNEVVDAALRASRRTAQALQAEIDRVNRELSSLGSGSRMSVLEAEIQVEAQAAVKARIEVSYIVAGPSWRPDYVIRADSEAYKLSVQYRAIVRQSTGESWKDAALRLSTARPQVGGTMPTLSPWDIDVYRPAPSRSESAKMARGMAAPAPSTAMGAADRLAAETEPAPDMGYVGASAETGATAVLFSIPGATTVESDNRDRTVTIAVLDLPVVWSYAAVPKLSPYAYFRAEATNESDFPFLPGRTHIYVDGSYVADAGMAAVPTGGEFRADLGIDEAVTVERALKRKFDESTGVVAKKSKTTWEYVTTVKNGKGLPVVVTVSDQLPVSMNEQIVVKAIDPVLLKDTEALRKVDYETFEWTLRLAPRKEASIRLSFSVEYPRGTPVTGLE